MEGAFPFPVNSYDNGEIAVIYTDIPDNINLTQVMQEEIDKKMLEQLMGLNMTTRVGLSDAYTKGSQLHEYHRMGVDLGKMAHLAIRGLLTLRVR